MAKVQLTGSEKRALVLWVLAGVVGLSYAHRHFFDAFPEASTGGALRLEYFPDSDHLFSKERERTRLFRVIADWLEP